MKKKKGTRLLPGKGIWKFRRSFPRQLRICLECKFVYAYKIGREDPGCPGCGKN